MDLVDQAIAFLILILTMSLFLFLLFQWGSKNVLKVWAKKNNLILLSTKRYQLSRGPFIRASHRQFIFEIKAQLEDGTIKFGYVCIGSVLFGLIEYDRIEVLWKD